MDITSLKSATTQLETAINYSRSKLAISDEKIFEQFRNSVVQCFEYTYELSTKMLRRFFELSSDNQLIVDEWDFKDLIRESAIKGLITSPEDWFNFRKLRNISSHAYDKAKADEVYSHATLLLTSAKELIAELEIRLKSE